MPIDFSPERWHELKAACDAWWAGEQERPLVPVVVTGGDPGRPEPEVAGGDSTAAAGLDVSAEAIVDRWDWDLSQLEFLGDAFPWVWPNFGPGVLAAFLGARPEVRPGTVWFHPPEDEPPPEELSLSLDLEHPWLRRIANIYRAACERWGGRVQLAMTDLGGALDILASFRPASKLMMDFYDRPEEIKRVTWEIHEAWKAAFTHFDAILQPTNPGYTPWAGTFSTRPHYMLQCDLAYMIGPETFAEFVVPELAATCEWLGDAFYHLDGPGQLVHLDALLEIDALKGVQWIPGAGAAPPDEWIEVYERIQRAGKRIQFAGTLAEFDRVVQELGSPRGFVLFHQQIAPSDADAALLLLKRYGAV